MWGLLKALAAWLKDYESVAIWLEGIALVLILGLDWRERIDQRKERKEQHRETSEQLAVSHSQIVAAMNSADAAMKSAEAAKLSAEISVALHRPLVGLESLPTERLASNTIWEFPTKLWNYGTLPASHLCASFAFYTESGQESRHPLKNIEGPESVEIFPNSGYEIALQPSPSPVQVNHISSQTTKLILTVKATYSAPDDRNFEYTAEARLDNASRRFVLIKSQTRIL
jgi:hypothetical protein